jgi:phosphoribosylformylglycinamidine synthase
MPLSHHSTATQSAPGPREGPENRRWHVRVSPRSNQPDSAGRAVLGDIHQLGLTHIEEVRSERVYFFSGRLSESDIRLLAGELLTDPVAERFEYREGFSPRDFAVAAVEVHPLPGVMNPVALTTLAAARQLLTKKGSAHSHVEEVQTARRYYFSGARSSAELEQIAGKVLANDCVEKWFVQGFDRRDPIPETFPDPPSRPFALRRVRLNGLADPELAKLSRDAHLFLSVEEMRTIRDHFVRLERDPTDLELETLAQTWSEHCVHKTLKSAIEYHGTDFGRAGEVKIHFDNLLKNTIVKTTHELAKEWCLSVFVDNAGVIAFDEDFGIAFKVETHNHPSAIEPYGGAATGVGGCIRDVMGCGLGAKPIASTDVFCLAPPDFPAERVPAGVLHPRRTLKGVVGGVRDYGNRMGIPTVNGAIYFDERYLANPLVFCGCVGLIPRNRIDKKAAACDFIVVAGGRTGRDGIHGATFSSSELTDTHADEFSHAVQIGNAIEEKKLLDAQLIARDHANGCLYSAVTDCGAGGLSSAVGEMGEHLGALVDLEKVPLKYAGLRYDEIWISEAQERMVFAVPPEHIEKFMAVFAAEEVEASIIGQFTNDRVLRVRFNHQVVCELQMEFLHHGLPKTKRTARWKPNAEKRKLRNAETDKMTCASRITEIDNRKSTIDNSRSRLLSALQDLNVASKEWVIRQYDHEVQGRSVMKPLVGPMFGPSDAAVLRPLYTSQKGIALGCGLCPHWSDIDPYWMAARAVDEAFRNVICVGADPERVAILDNFCWPKADTEESLGALVRTCKGASDVALAYGLPFISGKDSLNNQFSMSEAEARRTGLPRQLTIPPTLLISAIGIVENVGRCVTMDLKSPGHVLVLATGNPGFEFSISAALAVHRSVAELIQKGQVFAAHDVSDGGLAVTLAEMCIASDFGATIELNNAAVPFDLFDEPAATYVLEMPAKEATDSGLPVIGTVTAEPVLRIRSSADEKIEVPVSDLDTAWRSPLTRGESRS